MNKQNAMLRKMLIPFFVLVTAVISCKTNQRKTYPVFFSVKTLDSITGHADSLYTKPYKQAIFVTADYYISKKDSVKTQVMRDSLKRVRQVISTKKNIRTYFAQYYANGQLMADLKLDQYGQYEGPAVYYDENGAVTGKGVYHHGLAAGEWKEYDAKGDSVTVKYNENGNRIN